MDDDVESHVKSSGKENIEVENGNGGVELVPDHT